MRERISRVFAKSEKTVGGAAPATQPTAIHLVRDRGLEWSHREQVVAAVRDLRSAGFETITTFRIAEIESLRLVGLAHRKDGYLAVVYEHAQAGVWCNLVAVYDRGGSLTLSNARQGRELEQMPGHEKHLLRGASIAKLFKGLGRNLRDEPLLRIVPGNFVQVFEEAYAKEIAWRQSAGSGAPATSAAAIGSATGASAPATAAAVGEPSGRRDPELDRRCAPLFAAIEARDAVQVREFLSRGNSPEGRDAYGRTALMAAAASEVPEVVEPLVEYSADVNARAPGLPGDALGANPVSGGFVTPLTAALESGDPDVLTLLLAAGAELEGPSEPTPLQFAALQGDIELAGILLAAGAEVDRPGELGYTPLFSAAAEGYFDVVELLVGAGADVHFKCDGETAITLAAVAGASDVVEFLATRVKGRLCRRAEKMLREAGLGPDPKAKRLMMAAMNGKAAMVDKLLEFGVSPDAVEYEDENAVTALMVATQEGHLEVMKRLLAAGADVNHADSYGTALKRALNPTFMDADRQPLVIRLLIESGAGFERLDNEERRLLAEAIRGI